MKLFVCIPTYRREVSLVALAEQLMALSPPPSGLIIVDGDPSSGKVHDKLKSVRLAAAVYLVPSNHANLPYQRYLGWRLAKVLNADILLYLDDDLRVDDRAALNLVVGPISRHEALGCGTEIKMEGVQSGDTERNTGRRGRFGTLNLFRRCGSSASLAPGKLAPSGHRVPAPTTLGEYASVSWLRGGVMGFSMQTLSDECFSHDLFAMYERRMGKGEDTHLSSRVAAKGHLLLSGSPAFRHPNTSSPVAYPTAPCKLGFSRAYSRRLLNDNYRWPGSPTFTDRLALLKSYCGTSALNWFRALVSLRAHDFAYAWGYTCGALRGLIQPPNAQRLTPIVDWASDAQAALTAAKIITAG